MSEKRPTLTRERVLEGAVTLADEIGIEALTIRRLAEALETKPMTIYYHVPSKDDIVDGMVEIVFAEIERPGPDEDWRQAIRNRCVSARQVLRRHPWAAPLMESRTSPGPANLGHHEAVLSCLRRGGMSWQMTAHAYAVLDSFVYGFAFQEATLPAYDSGGFPEAAREIGAGFDAEAYPHLIGLMSNHVFQPGYDFGISFEFGLDLILDGLERAAG
ncbi:MAG: TetR/AcrR family transcriptional regulator [Acidimicrobiia bacterium]|nr:TetR/AcrR family transcriptional regulator [Acidimicrobiia bacterium]MDH4307800.1 TetR/AcrR family transcriptional regulator [Acidimicrobiia bacterium]MDH5294566.1 TetR/AcrR family transcriptional regulator [Acidimicrobiia bacterium]